MKVKDFSILQNTQPSYGAYLASYSMGAEGFSPEINQLGCEVYR
jgi:hypothetical protein